MRTLNYLSPTSLAKYLESADDFYMNYLAETRPPRPPQTQPMSIGSAFDAYAKSYLFEKLNGKSHSKWPEFEFSTLFEKQVEIHNRDWALKHGKFAFDAYVKSGALADIFVELENCVGEARFEMDIMGLVSQDIFSVPFMGKPDVFFINSEGCPVILDWKVNGYCSRSGVSPMKGYIKIFPGWDAHKDAWPVKHRGIMVNGIQGLYLENIEESWARQTTIYAWLCGCTVGEDFIIGIDQVACSNRNNPQPGYGIPEFRFAKHRYRSNREHQYSTYRQAAEVWKIVNSGAEGYFQGLSPEDSKCRCEALERRAKELFSGPKDQDDADFRMAIS